MNKRLMFLFCSILCVSLSAEEVSSDWPETASNEPVVQDVVAKLVRKEVVQDVEPGSVEQAR